jgi:hypothetical protein
LDVDVVYQLTREATSNPEATSLPNSDLQKPIVSQSKASEPFSSTTSKRAEAPIRLAALDGGTGYFSNLKPREAMIEIVRPIDNPDLIWDPNSHDVIAWGDVVAYHVDQNDIPSVIDRTAAVRELKTISTKAPQLLRISTGDEQHHNDDVVAVEVSDVARRSIILFNISGDGTVQMLYPLGPDANQTDASSFQISLRVRRPFGADQIVAVTSTERLPELEQALSDLNRRRAPGQVIRNVLRYMPANTRIGSIGIFTAP